jgi:hypothetical protein
MAAMMLVAASGIGTDNIGIGSRRLVEVLADA